MMTYEQLRQNEKIKTYILSADNSLKAMGYTEHNFAHVTKTAVTAAYILTELGYDEHTVELAKIAGLMHDIGNLVNRVDHSQSGAIMAFRILDKLDFDAADIAVIVSAIGNHDEGTGVAVNPAAAALILADKSDVRRSRVRNADFTKFDIHDRVNYSVVSSELELCDNNQAIKLTLEIDTTISPVMDYFEIFLGRMSMCRRAAESLGLKFKLVINGQNLI